MPKRTVVVPKHTRQGKEVGGYVREQQVADGENAALDSYATATRGVSDYDPIGPRSAARCPHGDEVGMCDRGACDEGWEREPQRPMRSYSPSEKQRAFIRRLARERGVDAPNVRTSEQASQVISQLKAQPKKSAAPQKVSAPEPEKQQETPKTDMATPKQVGFLKSLAKRKNYEFEVPPEQMTKREASQNISKLKD